MRLLDRAPDGLAGDALWYYAHPAENLAALASRACFHQERGDDFRVDGVPWARHAPEPSG